MNVKVYRLTSVVQGINSYTFAYNGLGDRLSQTVDGNTTDYTLDLVAGLTQVLGDGTNAYLYGAGRIGEQGVGGWQYPLGDALGSVRQLTDSSGDVMLANAYEPFGSVLTSIGDVSTNYGFTGEWTDGTELVQLRARYYAPWQGRFVSRDVWEGDLYVPMSYSAWLYVYANPVNLTDPSGLCEHMSGYDYCEIVGGDYDGAIIDRDHYASAKNIATQIRKKLNENKGLSPGLLKINEPQIGVLEFRRHYHTWIPENTSDTILDRINLGIFMDYEWNLEAVQSLSCLTPWCSGFANEDLPSDYLGFVAAVMMPPGTSLNDIVRNQLGAERLEPTNDLGIYKANWFDTYACFHVGVCGEDNPYNISCDFTYKLFVEETGKFINKPWPKALQKIIPIGRGIYWEPLLVFPITLN